MALPPEGAPFAGCFATEPERRERARLAFVGLPDDSQSSYRRGCARGPEHIRTAYNDRSYNASTESGVDLTGVVADLGDLPSQATWEATARLYRDFASALYRHKKFPFFAGGDHAVTVPVVEALAALGEPVHVVQIDAHPDLYPVFEGSQSSHACVAARLLEMPHVASLTQLGIRTLNPAQAEVAERFRERLRCFLARDLTGELPPLDHLPASARVYLTLDLDALDPAFAPGVSHPVPGGLTSRQVINFLHQATWQLVGMDVVELNPTLDVNNQTAVLAARLLHQAMGYASK